MIGKLKDKFVNPILVHGKEKVFCIGHNKTGTCSLQKALEDLGYITGHQGKGELLFKDYKVRKYDRIIKYCNSAQAFQDIPFTLPYLYIVLDYAFPGSKFILTVRGNGDQWYESLTKYHSKKYGNGSLPTADKLREVPYRYKGFVYDMIKTIYKTPDDDLYNKNELLSFYQKYNADIIDYFKYRKDDLLVINLAEHGSYNQLCKFLNKSPVYESFPWVNKTEEVSS